MKVTNISKGRTQKVVTVEGAGETPESEVVEFARQAAGETEASLFGYRARFYGVDEVWEVTLFTD